MITKNKKKIYKVTVTTNGPSEDGIKMITAAMDEFILKYKNNGRENNKAS